MCLPSDRVVIGWLYHWDFKCGIAVVNIRRARGFQEARLSSSHCVQFESTGNVVAVGRCFDSGMLKSINGMVIGSARDELYELMLSTSKINTVSCCFFLALCMVEVIGCIILLHALAYTLTMLWHYQPIFPMQLSSLSLQLYARLGLDVPLLILMGTLLE